MTVETGSIKQIHLQLRENGYYIAENTLRAWVKQGILPAAYSGRKAYIDYSNVLHILKNGTAGTPVENSNGGIRRISA